MDVVVDLRSNSDTYGHCESFELTQDKHEWLFVPKGFAHGFCTLTDVSEVQYKVDNYYSRENEGGIAWDDPDLAIPWPVAEPILSEKDGKNMRLQEFVSKYKSMSVWT